MQCRFRDRFDDGLPLHHFLDTSTANMNKQQFVFLLILLTCFLNGDRFLQAQQTQRHSAKDLSLPPAKRTPSQAKLDRSLEQSEPATKFIRLTKDADGAPEALQTSITRYRGEGGLLVDLIGVIHVGEREYYRKLDKQFEQYESMLYELVAPPESRVPNRHAAGKSSNPIHWLQGTMQRMLGLESQLQHIDYTKSNFVHADLSPQQMQQKLAERGETVWSVGMQAITEMMNKQSEMSKNGQAAFGQDVESIEDLFGMLSDSKKLKQTLATQFASGGALEAGLGGTLNQILIKDRNKAAMEVLKSEIEKGNKKIAIFYGAAHMPDFEQRLLDELGMRKTKQAWVDAWDLQTGSQQANPVSGIAEMFFQLMDSIDQ